MQRNERIEKDPSGSAPAVKRKPIQTAASSSELNDRHVDILTDSTISASDPQPTRMQTLRNVIARSPAVHRMHERRALVLNQFVETDGDSARVARRHGVRERDVERAVASMIRPMIQRILQEVA